MNNFQKELQFSSKDVPVSIKEKVLKTIEKIIIENQCSLLVKKEKRLKFKTIHIGTLINRRVRESGMEILRISNYLNTTEEEIEKMYHSQSLDTEILLKWSKLLGYDFFRIYTQHLILYAPLSASVDKRDEFDGKEKSDLPQFKKNIYTKEIISFILELIRSGEKTKQQIIEDYGIPKTTLYRWLNKY